MKNGRALDREREHPMHRNEVGVTYEVRMKPYSLGTMNATNTTHVPDRPPFPQLVCGVRWPVRRP
jgi:hypothetical protein